MTPVVKAATEDNGFDAPWATIVVLVLIIIGGVDIVVDNHLSEDYKDFLEVIAIPLAGLALGRGWAARKPG
jgi:hypothetical protein